MSSSIKLSEFFREKLTNMCAWLAPELEDMRPQIEETMQTLHTRTDVEWAHFVTLITSNSHNIESRQLDAMLNNLFSAAVAHRFAEIAEQKPELLDRFWRYMDMFSEVISNANQ